MHELPDRPPDVHAVLTAGEERQLKSLRGSGGCDGTAVLLAPVGHEAKTAKADEHHCPSGGLGDVGDVVCCADERESIGEETFVVTGGSVVIVTWMKRDRRDVVSRIKSIREDARSVSSRPLRATK